MIEELFCLTNSIKLTWLKTFHPEFTQFCNETPASPLEGCQKSVADVPITDHTHD